MLIITLHCYVLLLNSMVLVYISKGSKATKFVFFLLYLNGSLGMNKFYC